MSVSPELTLHDIGLSPIEGQSEQAPFADYWAETYLPAVMQIVPLDGSVRRRVIDASRYVSRVTEKIFGTEERQLQPRIPGVEHSSIAPAIVGWDKSIGSLNVMAGGQQNMIRAAALLFQENIAPDVDDFVFVDPTTEKTEYKALMTLLRINGVASQKPNATLLATAELIHKAGWIDEDLQRQDHLFDSAQSMYRYICDSPQVDSRVRHNAQKYSSDIVFHGLSKKIRTAKQKGDIPTHDRAKQEMAEQIRMDAELLGQKYQQIPKGSDPQEIKVAKCASGLLFEDALKLALRRTIQAEALDDYEIRHAFSSEDNSLYGVLPKPSFDLVSQRFTPDEIVVKPAQIKHVSPNSSADKVKKIMSPDGYLPGIAYIPIAKHTDADIREATAAIADSQQFTETERRRKLAPFRQLRDQVGPILLAG